MGTKERILQLMSESGWSQYRLAKEAGLSQSTIANIFKRNTTPKEVTVEAICKGFGITLAQFYSEKNLVAVSDEQMELFDQWIALSPSKKLLVSELIRNMKD